VDLFVRSSIKLRGIFMSKVSRHTCVAAGFLLFVLSAGLLAQPGWVYAADRTVVGELFSTDG